MKSFIFINNMRNSLRLFIRKMHADDYKRVEIGSVSPERFVPQHIAKPSYYFRYHQTDMSGEPEIKNNQQILNMRASCKLAANVLKSCGNVIKVGIKTDEIDAFAHEQIINANAYPSPLRYAGFPKSICTSVNNVACHGIPDDRPLQDGDIVNIDVSVYLNGYHGDCSKTFTVGHVHAKSQYLVDKTEKCLLESILLCRPYQRFSVIGCFISRFCQENGLNVIPAFIGHGIGQYFHGPPEILHYANDISGMMLKGMTFTIEPILTYGGPDIEIQNDGWTAMTVDGSISAQFEHTILITEDSCEILTLPDA